jgi:hypothetical protein
LTSNPSRLASATGVVDEAAGPFELLHRPPAGHLRHLAGRVRHDEGRQEVANRRLGCLEILASDGPDVDLEVAALGDDVGTGAAGDDADVDVTPGQRPFSSWMRLDEVGRGEDRIAALLGLDAGVGGPAVDRDPGVEDALARRDDVAVRPGALEDEARVGVRGERPDVRGRRR